MGRFFSWIKRRRVRLSLTILSLGVWAAIHNQILNIIGRFILFCLFVLAIYAFWRIVEKQFLKLPGKFKRLHRFLTYKGPSSFLDKSITPTLIDFSHSKTTRKICPEAEGHFCIMHGELRGFESEGGNMLKAPEEPMDETDIWMLNFLRGAYRGDPKDLEDF